MTPGQKGNGEGEESSDRPHRRCCASGKGHSEPLVTLQGWE